MLGVSNMTCATSLTYPLQLLWLGSALDPATNSAIALPSISHFRSAIGPSSCPILPTSSFAPLSVAYSRWSNGDAVSVALCGGRVAAEGVPIWAFQNNDLNATIPLINEDVSVEVAALYTTGLGDPISDAFSLVSVRVVRPSSTTATDAGALILHLAYVGDSRMSGLRVTVRVAAGLLLRCVGSEVFEMTYVLEVPPTLTDTGTVADGVGVGSTVASGLTGSPSGGGGILSSLSELLRCEPPDLTAEQPLLSNMFNIALGPEEGQYYRGGILNGVIVMCGLGVALCGIAVGSKMVSLRREYAVCDAHNLLDGPHHAAPPTWMDAARHSHLPGLMLVPMALVGEAFVPSGMTLITMDGAGAGDICLGISAVGVYATYLAHLLWTTIRVQTVGVRHEGHSDGETFPEQGTSSITGCTRQRYLCQWD